MHRVVHRCGRREHKVRDPEAKARSKPQRCCERQEGCYQHRERYGHVSAAGQRVVSSCVPAAGPRIGQRVGQREIREDGPSRGSHENHRQAV
eukprot:scaffold59450_cov57-Phaeocystis_antarctica.AAC.7